ncbi:hypothetical protein VRK_25530 [Vibrio sp. MEBiC08052]|nr:hypothetical protein VRK_25530 [Vibrio sp. MEBiC08052]
MVTIQPVCLDLWRLNHGLFVIFVDMHCSHVYTRPCYLSRCKEYRYLRIKKGTFGYAW